MNKEELFDLYQKGKVLVLPCKIGDTVYQVALLGTCKGCPHIINYEYYSKCNKYDEENNFNQKECDRFSYSALPKKITKYSQILDIMTILGDSVFLTKEEALSKIKELEKERGNNLC